MKDDFNPDWSKSKDWNEYDWEMAMRHRDKFAAKYLALLDKFGDLPGSDEIILQKLGNATTQPIEEDDYYVDLNPEDVEELDDDSEDDEDFEGAFYYETTPAYMILRQVSIGWCNIYATFLLPELRKYGVNILFLLCRAIAQFAGRLGVGEFV